MNQVLKPERLRWWHEVPKVFNSKGIKTHGFFSSINTSNKFPRELKITFELIGLF